LRAAVLKPPVFGAVDLDQLANAIAAMPRLVHRLQPLPAVLLNPVHQHPAPHRLNAEMQAMPLRPLLCSKRQPECLPRCEPKQLRCLSQCIRSATTSRNTCTRSISARLIDSTVITQNPQAHALDKSDRDISSTTLAEC